MKGPTITEWYDPRTCTTKVLIEYTDRDLHLMERDQLTAFMFLGALVRVIFTPKKKQLEPPRRELQHGN